MVSMSIQRSIYKVKEVKKKLQLLLIIFFIVYGSQISQAADFYPELGVDPFFSSLSPTYDPAAENSDDQETSNIVTSIKEKLKQRKLEKQLKQQLKLEEKASKEVQDKDFDIVTAEQETVSESDIDSTINADENIEELTPNRKKVTVKELEAAEKKSENANTQKKSIKEFFKYNFITQKKQPKHEDVPENPKIELFADFMEYYPDRFEVEAIGNAKIIFTGEDTVLTANKIVYNYDRNIIKAKENVVLTTKDSITEGDFVRIDLGKPSGWIQNPITTTEDIRLTAKEANLYSDRIEEYDGVARILKNEVIAFRANSFASYVDQSGILQQTNKDRDLNSKKGMYTLKAKTVYIDSKKDHEIITVKNADLYLKNRKVAVIPSARIVSNKKNTVIESNFPEFGSQSLLGMHAGPAVVLNVPGGSTLKLAPILTYSDSSLGIGGIAKFRHPSNVTEIAYGTSRNEILIKGRQKILPGLNLNYSRLTNESEWFLGFRKPKYAASLNYTRSDYVKDLKLRFSQVYSAGAFVDYRKDANLSDAEGRFRWMTQSYKTLYNYKNNEGTIGVNAGLIAQTAATVYTTGDVAGLLRFGPAINTNVGRWRQSLMYFQTASAGQTPFYFDRYRYGRSNVVLIESLRVCKYLTLGYLASLAINRDVPSDDLFQENRFLLSIGPDYAKVTLGYDSIRHNTMVLFSMLVGTQDSELEFKKTVIQNPDKIGKTSKPKKKDTKKKNYKRFLKEKITPSTIL